MVGAKLLTGVPLWHQGVGPGMLYVSPYLNREGSMAVLYEDGQFHGARFIHDLIKKTRLREGD